MIKLKDLIPEVARREIEFQSGVALARQDAETGKKRELTGYPPEFIRGYKSVKRPGLLKKASDWLTKKAVDLGQSYSSTKRFGGWE